jgi:hypothetical protein
MQIDFHDLAISVRYMNTIFSLDRIATLWLYEPRVQCPFHQFLALAPVTFLLVLIILPTRFLY